MTEDFSWPCDLGHGRLPLRSILSRRRARAHGATREARVLPGTAIIGAHRWPKNSASDQSELFFDFTQNFLE